jgi:thiamine-monophosphate kinase
MDVSTEHERIARIRTLFARSSPAISLGIGDDCAVLTPSLRARVWTVDAAIENVHFTRGLMRDEEIGFRALMAAASDIAAMGAEATGILCALALPASFSDHELDALLSGFAAAADALQCPVVGGNLTRASELSITTSVLGETALPLTRAGARPGHGLFVTGTLGGAALGFAALRAGQMREGAYSECIQRFLAPRARLDLVAALAQCATAAIDISDGLAQDLAHLCTASGVGARVELASVPSPAQFVELARSLGQQPSALVLAGGEDYELLFSAELGSVPSALAVQIGTIEGDPSLQIIDAAGHRLKAPAGFDHFR